MNDCNDFELLINQQLDGELNNQIEIESLDKHIKICSNCQNFHKSLVRMKQLFRGQWPENSRPKKVIQKTTNKKRENFGMLTIIYSSVFFCLLLLSFTLFTDVFHASSSHLNSVSLDVIYEDMLLSTALMSEHLALEESLIFAEYMPTLDNAGTEGESSLLDQYFGYTEVFDSTQYLPNNTLMDLF